jgi:hypothetical protein
MIRNTKKFFKFRKLLLILNKFLLVTKQLLDNIKSLSLIKITKKFLILYLL